MNIKFIKDLDKLEMEFEVKFTELKDRLIDKLFLIVDGKTSQGVINDLGEVVFPKGKIPFAAAKAVALIKFLACVNGARIVLAICDVALGYKTRF